MSEEVKSEATIVPQAEGFKKPESGYEMAMQIGASPEETVIVAVFPSVIEEITTKEIPFLDTKGDHMHVVLANCTEWGVRAIDVVSQNDQPVKWWRVKAMVSDLKIDFVPVRWQGPIGEIPSKYFEKDYVLAIRFYVNGPWWFPKEQPQLRTDTEESGGAVEEPGSGTDGSPGR